MFSQPLSGETYDFVPKDLFYYIYAIGSLLYISAPVRPGVAESIAVLSRFSNFPGAINVRACRRVAMYLLNIPKY